MVAEKALRLRVVIRGAVQGVGFRPFVYRLATGMGLTGWVINSSQGVFIEVEGERPRLEAFLLRLEPEKPPAAFIHSLESSFLDAIGFDRFEIRESEGSGEKSVLVLPDLATCAECRAEIFDPLNRRYRYPFTNCTNCGPRYSIIQALPYDRPNTTMAGFPMCDACRREYEDPADRRFHAQPNACPRCGPHLELWDREGRPLATHHEALLDAAMALRTGSIVAVKGLGGYHLMADARNEDAVQALRQRKHREEKPLALLFPSLRAVREYCEVSALEERLLCSTESPIVLLRRRDSGPSVPLTPGSSPARGEGSPIAPSVAPGNPHLGVMLPYTPLHHVLLRAYADLVGPDRPALLVMTSGNRSDEPIAYRDDDARARLAPIADGILAHNRAIHMRCDDSVARIVAGGEQIFRRSRGYAPEPIALAFDSPIPLLACGGQLKNTFCLVKGRQAFVSQHIGDLENLETLTAFREGIAHFQRLFDIAPQAIAYDLHRRR